MCCWMCIELRVAARHTQSSGVASGAPTTMAPFWSATLVYAELVPAFGDRLTRWTGRCGRVNATLSPIDSAIAYGPGMRWMRYRQAGRTEGADHGRLSDWGSCLGRRRHVSNPGSWLLCDVLSGVEDSAGVVPAHGLWARTCPEEAGLRPAPTKARPTNGITVS